MIFRLNPQSGVPIYLQLIEQVKHGIENGALRPGDQLPGIRKLAESIPMNPNTVAKAYKELEHMGLVELRQGSGAFIAEGLDTKELTDRMQSARPIVEKAIEKLLQLGLSEEEVRRLMEAELAARKVESSRV
ncbi:GntR family transcriptional regulator [Nostoc sp. NIES-2111]